MFSQDSPNILEWVTTNGTCLSHSWPELKTSAGWCFLPVQQPQKVPSLVHQLTHLPSLTTPAMFSQGSLNMIERLAKSGTPLCCFIIKLKASARGTFLPVARKQKEKYNIASMKTPLYLCSHDLICFHKAHWTYKNDYQAVVPCNIAPIQRWKRMRAVFFCRFLSLFRNNKFDNELRPSPWTEIACCALKSFARYSITSGKRRNSFIFPLSWDQTRSRRVVSQ